MELPSTILVATDFSPQADIAVRYAVQLASALKSRCIIAHAYRAPILSLRASTAVTAGDILLEVELEARTKLEETRRAFQDVSPPVEWRLIQGDPRDAILELASAEQSNLIVLGTRGRGGAARLLLGSIAEYLVRHASCPVLVVPERPRAQ
jgi:nucleotide-binding universal stress UspA family protein